MKHLHFNSAERSVLVIAIIMLAGGVTSIALTKNPDWMTLHLSRLGEGGNLSSYIFNATAAFSGLAMLGLVWRLQAAPYWATTSGKGAKNAHMALGLAFRAISICLVGLAIFPYDKFVAVHNTFGYGMTVIFLLLVTYLTFTLPVFSKLFRQGTVVFLTLMLGLFAFYFIFNGRQITLLQIQFLGLSYFFVWLAVLVRQLNTPNTRSAPLTGGLRA